MQPGTTDITVPITARLFLIGCSIRFTTTTVGHLESIGTGTATVTGIHFMVTGLMPTMRTHLMDTVLDGEMDTGDHIHVVAG